jgi:pyruvate-ferredoxin/flavodoxin oxidoreductase
VSHLFQDAPSVAIGLFEGHMRKMADGFAAVRRAELELAGEYDPPRHDPELARLDWHGFTDDELALCPPILAVGGDGAMLDIGFQNLSRLLASGKPIRVVMLDTQVYSSTGGQACTSGFLGQVSDMAEYGPAQRGKEETRKELALLAMAHRNVFVLQSSQAAPSHLLGGVLRGLQSRYPAVLSLHCPCPPEHGLGDERAPEAARLTLESRAFPLLVYDPAAGPRLGDRLSLDGNPAGDEPWPTYELRYRDESGAERSMELPVTVADWAATEGRFRKHFSPLAPTPRTGTSSPSRYLGLPATERAGKTPFVYTLERDRRLGRLSVADEVVRLAEDRQEVWTLLRDMAGLKTPEAVALQAELERQAAALRAEYEAKLADLRGRYPRVIARRLAESLLRAGDGAAEVGDLLARVEALPGAPRPDGDGMARAATRPAPAAAVRAAAAVVALAAAPAPAPAGTDEPLVMEPAIDSALCTACNECTNLNRRMFAYNDKKQAYIKDPGRHLQAARPGRREARCASSIPAPRSTRRRRTWPSGSSGPDPSIDHLRLACSAASGSVTASTRLS